MVCDLFISLIVPIAMTSTDHTALTNMVNLYLGSAHEAKIVSLAKASDKQSELDGYAREALSTPIPFFLILPISSSL